MFAPTNRSVALDTVLKAKTCVTKGFVPTPVSITKKIVNLMVEYGSSLAHSMSIHPNVAFVQQHETIIWEIRMDKEIAHLIHGVYP
jgi:hypothetical protein